MSERTTEAYREHAGCGCPADQCRVSREEIVFAKNATEAIQPGGA